MGNIVKIAVYVFLVVLLNLQSAEAAFTPPALPNGSVQISNGTAFGALLVDTDAAFKAHNAIQNGLSYDPRDPAYGAVCGGYNTFAGDGTTVIFTYTIPFRGSNSTDNSSFMVFYEPNSGFGTATILNTSQFTVTGVNSGTGGTITLNSAPPAGNTLVVVHDDSAGFVSASTASAATGGYVSVPDGCTIYGSQATGTALAEGAQLIGQGFTPNYAFQGTGIKPIVRVISPATFAPATGFNISNRNQQFYEGFEITSNVPGNASLGFLAVPVLIGVNGNNGAGGGQSPGIVVQYNTFNEGKVGFGAPIGGNAQYIFAVARFNNFTANTAGIYGPLSDQQIIGNNFNGNGAFGSIPNAGGMVIGPVQGAAGASGAARVLGNRFEFNSTGMTVLSGALINMGENQFDGNSACGLDLNTFWANITMTGGWFRGNANGGGTFQGNTTAGQDAHICFNGGSGSGNLHASNVQFFTNYSEGSTAPLGSNNATTPPYVLDFNTAAANNDNVRFDGGTAQFVAGGSGASVTDFAIYRNGRPPHLVIDMDGQATQGKLVNGQFPSQPQGLPSNSWSGYTVFGDNASNNDQFIPLSNGYAGLVGKNIGLPPTYHTQNDFSHYDCDVVNNQIIPNSNPNFQGNPVVTWLPSPNDVGFGAGFYQQHQADTNACRMGALTWMTVPNTYKVYGQNAGCVATGSWTNSTSYGGAYGVVSQTNLDTLACTTTTNGGPIYLWYQMNGSNGGTFTYQLDSGPKTTVATQGNNQFTFPISSSSFTLGGVRIPVPSTGSHTINIQVTSSTSASNTVTIEGIGTTPGGGMPGTAPTVFLGGQVYTSNSFPAAISAFNNDQFAQAIQLATDGLNVKFADVEKYFNFATDVNGSGNFYSIGQTHFAQAFSAAMQAGWNSMNAVNPLDYGASCNSLYFTNGYSNTNYAASTTSGSPTITISNYIFQPGVATQTGGGDVGKRICIGPGSSGVGFFDPGPCTYIASVDTVHNTANIGYNAAGTNTGTGVAVMGGYPTNPNDPSTAADDTIYIQNAGNAALKGGGKVFLPSNCMVHNLTMPQNIVLEGNAPGDFYNDTSQKQDPTAIPQATILNCGMTGFPDDTQQCVQVVPHTRYKNIFFRAPVFPYTPFGISAACLGYSTNSNSGPGAQILTENLSFFGCPVDIGQAYGFNHPVTFTASMAGNQLTVSAITSSNFVAADNWNPAGGGTGLDFLSIGRSVTGASVPANTTILTVPPRGAAGVYTVSTSATISSETMTSPANTSVIELRDTKSQHIVGGIGYNGDFTDSVIENSTCTGDFMAQCWRIGPNLNGVGNGGNRWIGGRMEEMTLAGITCDSCQVTTTGLDFDFNGGYNIRTLGSGSIMEINGGGMQAGGHCSGFHNAMIRLGGTNPSVSVDGVYLGANDFGSGCGGSTNFLFSSEAGATLGGVVSVTGGLTRPSSGGVITNLFDWTNGTPTSYKQSTAGWPLIDSTQTKYTATGCSLSATTGSGTSGKFTSGTTGTCTVTITPYGTASVAQPNGYSCTASDQTTPANLISQTTGGSTTTAVITGTTVSGDIISFSCIPN